MGQPGVGLGDDAGAGGVGTRLLILVQAFAC